jgi:Competence protein J (ComJ)
VQILHRYNVESLSFKTLHDYGVAKVKPFVAEKIKNEPDIIRAIVVPFEVALSEEVEITSIDQGEVVEVPSGNYALVYQSKVLDEKEELCLMSFIPNTESVEPTASCKVIGR